MDCFDVGRVREQPPCEILSVDKSRTAAIGDRNRAMGTDFVSDGTCVGTVLRG